MLGVLEIREYEKYLGLPVVVGRNKRASLTYIKDRVWGKLQGWKEKNALSSWKRSFIEGSGPSNSHLCHELLPVTYFSLPRY